MRKAMRLLGIDLREKARLRDGSESASAVLKAVAADGTSAMILYRLMQGSREAGLVPLEYFFSKFNSLLNGCVIGRGAEFGPGFVIGHAMGVVINGKVRGGSHVYLEHGVTLGDSGAGGCPVLGDRVYVGCGATVVGAIAVGSGARVGSNAVVVHDVAPDTTVVGIPARPVARRGGVGSVAARDVRSTKD